jgi:hypothetical protein
VNGTWSQVASPSGYSPLYHSSAVLPDGRVIIEGGEFNTTSGARIRRSTTTRRASGTAPAARLCNSGIPRRIAAERKSPHLSWALRSCGLTGRFLHRSEQLRRRPHGDLQRNLDRWSGFSGLTGYRRWPRCTAAERQRAPRREPGYL